MTEAEWLACEDPWPMLEAVGGTNGDHPDRSVYGQAPLRLSPRKLRLFACGCCRLAWGRLTDARSRLAVEVAERYADGEATAEEARAAFSEAETAWRCVRGHALWLDAAYCAHPLLTSDVYGEFSSDIHSPAAQAALLRCVAGNPWRPVTLPAGPRTKCNCRMYGRDGWVIDFRGNWRKHDGCDGGGWIISPSPWLTPTVVALARAAYAERLPDGLLAPDRLAVLADALGDAGCEDGDLLGHLRSPGPHARGCHALDLILGRS